MKDNGNLANLARSKSKETEDGGNSKPRNNKPEITNNFMKVKKDFLEKKSKLLKKDQKQMMVMHDI